jgi:hypothetical protein
MLKEAAGVPIHAASACLSCLQDALKLVAEWTDRKKGMVARVIAFIFSKDFSDK